MQVLSYRSLKVFNVLTNGPKPILETVRRHLAHCQAMARKKRLIARSVVTIVHKLCLIQSYDE
jgi:hypothetical protein